MADWKLVPPAASAPRASGMPSGRSPARATACAKSKGLSLRSMRESFRWRKSRHGAAAVDGM